MVSSGLANGLTTTRPKDSVLDLLFNSGLMAGPIHSATRKPLYERLTITSKGFQFLLEERQTQVWQILICYLDTKDVSCILHSDLFFRPRTGRWPDGCPLPHR